MGPPWLTAQGITEAVVGAQILHLESEGVAWGIPVLVGMGWGSGSETHSQGKDGQQERGGPWG